MIPGSAVYDMKGIRGSQIVQEVILRYKSEICEWQLSCFEIPEGFNMNKGSKSANLKP